MFATAAGFCDARPVRISPAGALRSIPVGLRSIENECKKLADSSDRKESAFPSTIIRGGRLTINGLAVTHIPIPVVVVDSLGIIRDLNTQFAARTGYSHDDLIGRPVSMLVPKRAHKNHGHSLDEYFLRPAIRSMGGAGARVSIIMADGKETPCEIALLPLGDERKHVAAFLGSPPVKTRNAYAWRVAGALILFGLGLAMKITGAVWPNLQDALGSADLLFGAGMASMIQVFGGASARDARK